MDKKGWTLVELIMLLGIIGSLAISGWFIYLISRALLKYIGS